MSSQEGSAAPSPAQSRPISDRGRAKDGAVAAAAAATTAHPQQDQPPNGGYGWVCVACCFLINAHTWGINSV